jgi:uncharacterized protein YheU (UPF0270 family)
MANFVGVPVERLGADLLVALLEEFASRDGTDYGEREVSLKEKVSELRVQLSTGELEILYDADSEEWDLVSSERAHSLLDE